MIGNQVALIKREIWEHPAVYVTPAAIAVVVALLSIAGVVTISAFDKEVNMALFGASNVVGDAERQAALAVHFIVTSGIFLVALGILTIFYCLDCLYAERKDKSILFWRSLPITDAETVISKLLTAMVAIPVATMAAVIVSHLLNKARPVCGANAAEGGKGKRAETSGKAGTHKRTPVLSKSKTALAKAIGKNHRQRKRQ